MKQQSIGLAGCRGGQHRRGTRQASAADIRVLASNAIKEAYMEFAPLFEKSSGHKLNTTWHGDRSTFCKSSAPASTFDW